MNVFFGVSLVLTFAQQAFCQCNEKPKLAFGGDYGFVKYQFNCPTYTFAYHGDTSKNWDVLNGQIDISQAPKKVLVFKNKVEKTIKKYSGDRFLIDLKFYGVDVNYPEKFQAFKERGRANMLHKYAKAKYLYCYRYGPNDTASYLIGVAVNQNGQIISHFDFPSKKYYRPLDKSFNYCRLIQIARKVQKDIDPIGEVKLEYDKKKSSFYWLISQQIADTREGINYLNQVIIDAADLSKAKTVKSHVIIVY